MSKPAPPRPHTQCWWVDPPRLLAGEYPGSFTAGETRRKLGPILDAGIRLFLDLTEERDGLRPYATDLEMLAKERGIEARRLPFPFPDMSVPAPRQMAAALDAVDEALAEGGGLYVHCWGGIGRTGTLVGCWLVRHGMTGQEALARIAEEWPAVAKSVLYPTSPQTPAQFEFVRNWKEPRGPRRKRTARHRRTGPGVS